MNDNKDFFNAYMQDLNNIHDNNIERESIGKWFGNLFRNKSQVLLKTFNKYRSMHKMYKLNVKTTNENESYCIKKQGYYIIIFKTLLKEESKQLRILCGCLKYSKRLNQYIAFSLKTKKSKSFLEKLFNKDNDEEDFDESIDLDENNDSNSESEETETQAEQWKANPPGYIDMDPSWTTDDLNKYIVGFFNQIGLQIELNDSQSNKLSNQDVKAAFAYINDYTINFEAPKKKEEENTDKKEEEKETPNEKIRAALNSSMEKLSQPKYKRNGLYKFITNILSKNTAEETKENN